MEYMKISCAGCSEAITGKEFLKCSFCHSEYDLECVNVTQRSFNSMRQTLKDKWKCPGCQSKERRGDNQNTPVRSSLQEDSALDDSCAGYVTKRKPLSAPPVLEDDSEEDVSLTKGMLRSIIKDEISRAVTESVGRIVKEQLQCINDILGTFKVSLSSIDTQLESLKSTLEERTKTIDGLRKENSRLRDSVQRMEEHIRLSEQQALVNDVDIVGVPESKGEVVVHVVMTLARKLGVSLTEGDIVSASRVGAARDEATGRARARPIVVRLVRRALRDDLLRASRVRRGVTTADAGLVGESRRFYVNERLTRENRQLFLKAREIGARLKWKFVWSKDGRVYARQRQDEDSPRHQLRSEADLKRVFGPDAVGSSDEKAQL